MRGVSLPQTHDGQVRGVWIISLVTFLLTAAVWTAYCFFPQMGVVTGIRFSGSLFLDLQGSLASGEAATLGLDPFLPNPLDVNHRPHIYSEWWLVTGKLGLTRADTLWVGGLLTALMLVSALFNVRPRGWRQGLIALFVLISPALLLAVDRANNDEVVFLLIGGALALLAQKNTAGRALGVVLLAMAAVAKYYPLIAVVVLLDARTRKEWLGWILLYGLVVVLAWPGAGIRAMGKYPMQPEWLYALGAPVIFRNFGRVAPLAGLLLGYGAIVALAGKSALQALKKTPVAEIITHEERVFACAAALILGCFVAGTSYVYKLIFCLWLLPWLWRTAPSRPEEFWRKATLVGLFAVLWGEGLLSIALNSLGSALSSPLSARILKTGLFISQLFTWALMIGLLRGVLIYVGGRLPRILGVQTGDVSNSPRPTAIT